MTKIYIAGPLFTEGERILLERIEKLCSGLGFNTYLPHRDGGIIKRGESGSDNVVLRDINELDSSQLVIAVLNGTDVDSGTSWEIGYAYKGGKEIAGYIDDTRVYHPEKQLNPMISASIKNIARTIEELKEILIPYINL